MTRYTTAALLLSVRCAVAQVGPAQDPCASDPETGPVTSQLRACSERRYRAATAALDTLVATVRASLDSARSPAFERSQTTWVAYRDAACEAAYREVFPGSFASIHRLDCLERLTRERHAEITRTYFPDP